jgi:hypothetical protein
MWAEPTEVTPDVTVNLEAGCCKRCSESLSWLAPGLVRLRCGAQRPVASRSSRIEAA